MKNVAFHYLHACAHCDGLLGRGSSHLKLCRVPHHAFANSGHDFVWIAAHIVFIGSPPRLAEDVVRLVPVVLPGNARKALSGVQSFPKMIG